MSTPVPPSTEDELANVGLLPGAWYSSPSGHHQPTYVADPRVRLFEADMSALASQVQNLDIQARAARSEAICAIDAVAHLRRVLNWLRETYDFDELTLRVIAHGFEISDEIAWGGAS